MYFIHIYIYLFQIIFNLVPDHDADAFRLPYETESGTSNAFVSKSLSGFSRWDAQYFLHVTLYGYTHENTLAFFPLFPLTLRFFTSCLSYFLSSILSELNCALIAGVFLNSILSSLASIYLYKLTFVVFHSEIFAYTSALLFCINPASIFFSALYSEALFSLMTFSGLWTLESGQYWVSLSLLGLSAAVRSNGVLLLGFLIHAILKQHVINRYQITLYSPTARLILCIKTVMKMILSMLLFMIPFIMYQIYCYVLFCTSILPEPDIPEIVVDYVTRNDLKVPSEPTKWCFRNIPLAYTYVQSRYWDVGFLQYYTFKQIPNFILASPIAVLVFMSSIKYFYKNRRNVCHGGLLTYQYDNVSDLYSCSRCFPYFLYTLAVTIFCTFFIHVQVSLKCFTVFKFCLLSLKQWFPPNLFDSQNPFLE